MRWEMRSLGVQIVHNVSHDAAVALSYGHMNVFNGDIVKT